ncbi:MAG: hypothetical protein HYS07_04770 [Chlamydiae bacterium]|nr:hypothetical protein [Chlamydiota bacterium]MBI3276203.1 hypothetical protein [Chlamydiota bacterium]
MLFLCSGALWKKDESPVLAFCIGYQWLFVMIGYIYYLITGRFLASNPGDVEGAVFLSMLGFLVMTVGIRLAFKAMRTLSRKSSLRRENSEPYNIKYIFWIIILLYVINWFIEINPYRFFGLTQLFDQMLSFRSVFLVLLFLEIASQGKGYIYGIGAASFFFLPTAAGSLLSAWSTLFFMLFLVFISEWKPWLKTPIMRMRNKKILTGAVGAAVILCTLGLIWQGGGVKGSWRRSLSMEVEHVKPIEKMGILGGLVKEGTLQFDFQGDYLSLIERMSGVYVFTQVLDYVPKVISHEQGRLTWRAIEHALKPRFLFPDKPGLGSNSSLVIKYTGYWVAGEESGTSIGLTYMAEFYVDYGKIGMFIPLFFWGLLIGLTYRLFFVFSPSHRFACAAVITAYLQPFASYEGEIAYLLGGLGLVFLTYGTLLLFLGSWFHRLLRLNSVGSRVKHALSQGLEP